MRWEGRMILMMRRTRYRVIGDSMAYKAEFDFRNAEACVYAFFSQSVSKPSISCENQDLNISCSSL